ncbi:MAG: hypothetical protein V3V16_01530 [Melioribacteraceae bacterium]
MDYIEIIGYVGSVLVAVSLTMKNIYYLRIINLIGALAFTVYGFLVGALPVLIVNAFITVVDIYYIWESKKKKDYFTFLEIEKGKDNLLDKFFDFYKSDINIFFPNFTKETISNCQNFFILRNLVPVGLFSYKEISKTEILVEIDYAIPDYRDFKNARFIYFAQSKLFAKKEYKIVKTFSEIKAHQLYLKKIGFSLSKKSNYEFTKRI